MVVELQIDEVKSLRRKYGGEHRSLENPSIRLNLGFPPIRYQNCCKLQNLVARLMRQQNFVEASGALSVYLQATCQSKSPARNRFKYTVALELLKQIENGRVKKRKIQCMYDIWLKKIGSVKGSPVEDNFRIQREFIQICLAQGEVNEAYQAALGLMQEKEFGSDSMSSLVVGLTFYQLWYSNIPNMQIDWDQTSTPWQMDIMGTKSSNLAGYLQEYTGANSHVADSAYHCDSDTSVMMDKSMSLDTGRNLHGDASLNVDLEHKIERPMQNLQSQVLCTYSSEDNENEASFSDRNVNMQYPSVFSVYDRLDLWLLPIKSSHSTENLEDIINMHRELLNDHYKEAVKYLRLALYSTTPRLEALHPLVQLLLFGDQVDEAFNEVKKFCDNYGVLPLRLRASIVKCFDPNNFVELSTCLEDILKKDPACSNSLAGLVCLHQIGEYGPESLLEMIALHLDAINVVGYSTWKVFASCFLKIFQSEEGQMSYLGGHNKQPVLGSHCTHKMFTERKSRKRWEFRSGCWLTRHFSQSILASEISEGDLWLLTSKAACASHMYGSGFEYVIKVHAFIKEKNNNDLFLFLKMHMQNSIELYPISYDDMDGLCLG